MCSLIIKILIKLLIWDVFIYGIAAQEFGRSGRIQMDNIST